MKILKEKGWMAIMIVGAIWVLAVPIIDLILAFKGYDIPLMLSWAWCMVGVCILALGAVLGVSSKTW